MDGLECTKSWIDRSALRLAALAEKQEEGASAAKSTLTYADIMHNAFLELLEWPANLLFPEVLLI